MTDDNFPQNWIRIPLGEVVQPKRLTVRPRDYHGYKYIGLEHIESNTRELIGTVSAESMKSTALYFEPGDVLYGRLRPYLNKVYVADFTGLCSTEFIVFGRSHHLDSNYLGYLLSSPEFVSFATHAVEGDRPRIGFDRMKEFTFPLAPIQEQRRIAQELDLLFEKSRTVRERLVGLPGLLNMYKQEILSSAFSGKLTETVTKGDTATQLFERIEIERRRSWEKELKAQGKDRNKVRYQGSAEVDTRGLPELPEGWIWTRVEHIVADVATGATPLRSRRSYYTDGTIPWVTSGALNKPYVDHADEFITELAIRETNAKVFQPGTLLVAMYGEGQTRGRISELQIAAATNQACAALLFDDLTAQFRPYIKLFFQKSYEDVRRLASGGVQPNLNLSIIRNTLIPLAPSNEQARIVELCNEFLSYISIVEFAVATAKQRRERVDEMVLANAFRGGLGTYNPNDEPAEKLLGHIRQERDSREAMRIQERRDIVATRGSMGAETMPDERETTKPLTEVLHSAGHPVTPEELFKQAMFDFDNVEEFYQELRSGLESAQIAEIRTPNGSVLLTSRQDETR